MTPTKEQIKAARKAADLTQTQAAALVCSTLRRWQEWEEGKHRIHPGLWELFLIKTKARVVGAGCEPIIGVENGN